MPVFDVDVVFSVCEVNNKSNLGVLGMEVLEGGLGIHAHMNGRLVEGNVVQLSMGIRL